MVTAAQDRDGGIRGTVAGRTYHLSMVKPSEAWKSGLEFVRISGQWYVLVLVALVTIVAAVAQGLSSAQIGQPGMAIRTPIRGGG